MKDVKNNNQIRVRTFIDDRYKLQHETLGMN